MNRAIILGGTGVLGRAIATQLLESGWNVENTGRNPAKMPAALVDAGASFVASDRRIEGDLRRVLEAGAHLLVDDACYTEADARLLIPCLKDVDSTVMLSSKAVYVDESGNHVNSEVKPAFKAPIAETNPTMKPGNTNYRTRVSRSCCGHDTQAKLMTCSNESQFRCRLFSAGVFAAVPSGSVGSCPWG